MIVLRLQDPAVSIAGHAVLRIENEAARQQRLGAGELGLLELPPSLQRQPVRLGARRVRRPPHPVRGPPAGLLGIGDRARCDRPTVAPHPPPPISPPLPPLPPPHRARRP